MVEEAVDPADLSILEAICGQIEEYARWGDYELPLGGTAPYRHGFVSWLGALQAGWASLPERIPRDVLLAWRDGHAEQQWDEVFRWLIEAGKLSPGGTVVPHLRCQDCHMALPNDGHDWTVCPVCGSGELAYMDLSRPWGEAWNLADGTAEAAA